MTEQSRAVESSDGDGQWWGEFSLPFEQWSSWQISLLRLSVWRSKLEWQFAWRRDSDPLSTETSFCLGDGSPPDLQTCEQARYILSDRNYRLNLTLHLADRSMVARPEVPVYVPVGEKAVLYVSTGIWVQALAGSKQLLDIPVLRPSDTWFGPNTREGELCYFSFTRARTTSMEGVSYPHRATTPVTVLNKGSGLLKIERLRVPSPLLGLYVNEAGQMVTDALVYRLDSDGSEDEASVKIESAARKEGYRRLCQPRKSLEDNLLAATLAKWFG